MKAAKKRVKPDAVTPEPRPSFGGAALEDLRRRELQRVLNQAGAPAHRPARPWGTTRKSIAKLTG